MKNTTKDWLSAAQDDIKSMSLLLKNPDLTNIVAFHAQQAIEKSLKALMEESEIEFIKTHNLKTLLASTNTNLNINKRVFTELDQLYLDSRYPGDIGLMPFSKPSMEDAQQYLDEAKKIYQEIEKRISTLKKDIWQPTTNKEGVISYAELRFCRQRTQIKQIKQMVTDF